MVILEMHSNYFFPIIVIAFEFFLIGLILIATCFFKVFFSIMLRKKIRRLHNIEAFFENIVSQNKKFEPDLFPSQWKKLDKLLRCLREFDTKYNNNEHWLVTRVNLISHIILPLARATASSHRWQLRFYAVESFTLLCDKENESFILNLVNDKIPIIYFHAISAAILHKSETAINAIIIRMATETWLTQSFHLQAFDNAPLEIKHFIEKTLNISNEPSIRAVGINILLKFESTEINWNITNDIHSENIPLKIAALKYFAHVSKNLSIPILIDCLKDEHWQIKTLALRRLSQLKAVDAIPQIAECLHDPDWGVRLDAAHSLNDLGEQGQKILESMKISLDPVAYTAAHHVLNIM